MSVKGSEKGRKAGEEATSPRKAKKRRLQPFHNIRAHVNPLSDLSFDERPTKPDEFDWSTHYPSLKKGSDAVSVLDIGCGYGGLTVALSKALPESFILGMEIRPKVVEFVEQTITKLREENPGEYNNISVLRSNAMKFLPNFFKKGQISTMFFLFPDPQFKSKTHKRRIISTPLLADYAYVLREGGCLYTVTDVLDLHVWMVDHLTRFPLFERISDAELEGDPLVPLVMSSTHEARKVEKVQGSKHLAVFRRRADPAA